MNTTYKTNRFLFFTLLFSTLAFAQEDEEISFETHTIFDDAQNAFSVAVADIDGDEDMDVLSASAVDNSIRWYENHRDVDGNVAFTEDVIFKRDPSLGNVTSVVAVDLDGDNDLDILMSNSGDFVFWYENREMDGSVEFIEHTVSTNIKHASSVAIADIDDDGDLDVVSAGYGDAIIRWHESNASTFNVAKVFGSHNSTLPKPHQQCGLS